MTPRRDARAASAGATRHETIYETPSDRELVVTRTFDAPRALVWAAFTDPKHVPNWHTGPEGTTMPVCEIDLRSGGHWRYVWRNKHGREVEASGIYGEVDPPKRFVVVVDKDGTKQTNTTSFAEEDGRTTVTVSMLFSSKEARDQGIPYARVGTDTNYARLDAYLASRTSAH